MANTNDIQRLINAIGLMKFIRLLDLSDTQISNESFEALSNLITTSNSLLILDLRFNLLTKTVTNRIKRCSSKTKILALFLYDMFISTLK